MKSSMSVARWSAVSLAVGTLCPAFSQTTLPEAVITATRFDEPVQTVPYGVSVLSAQDLRASGATSVADAISRMLGIPGRLDTAGGGNYSLDLRGFGGTADRNQVVVVDGRRLRLDDLSATNMAVVPIETVERIEVLRGSGTVQYGEGATGGVIVVTTKAGKGVERRNQATLGVRAGSNALREAYASATLASGPWSVDVSGKDSKSNGHRDNFASTNGNLQTTVQWSNDWLRLGATGGRQMVQSGWPGSLTTAQYAADATQAKSLVDHGSSKTEHAGLFAQAMVGDWELGADVNTQTKAIRNYSYGSAYDTDTSTLNGSLRARLSSQWGSTQNALAVGLDTAQWSNLILASSYSTPGTLSDSQSSALYFTDDLTLPGGATHLNVGLRSESIDKKQKGTTAKPSEHPVAWNLGLNQALSSALNAWVRTGTSYRLPTADEYSFAVTGGAVQMQTSRDWELGTRWTPAGSSVELRWYRHEMNGEIGYDPKANGPYGAGTGANVNFDPTRHQGLEIEARHSLSSAWNLRASASLREAKFTSGPYAGNDIVLMSPRAAAVGARWTPGAGHAVDASLNWADRFAVDFQNTCSAPAYTTMDMRYAYSAKTWEWSLGVRNLTDQKYYTLAYSCSAGSPSSIYPEAGRTLVFGLEMKL